MSQNPWVVKTHREPNLDLLILKSVNCVVCWSIVLILQWLLCISHRWQKKSFFSIICLFYLLLHAALDQNVNIFCWTPAESKKFNAFTQSKLVEYLKLPFQFKIFVLNLTTVFYGSVFFIHENAGNFLKLKTKKSYFFSRLT